MLLWFWLSANFLISRIIHIETTNEVCRGEYSVSGMFLKGHTFKTITVEHPTRCQMLCSQDVRCQSYNFIIGEHICELNNRTKEARPEDFGDDPRRFYMKGGFGRGNCFTGYSRGWKENLQIHSFYEQWIVKDNLVCSEWIRIIVFWISMPVLQSRILTSAVYCCG